MSRSDHIFTINTASPPTRLKILTTNRRKTYCISSRNQHLPWDSYLHKQMIKKIITIRKPKRRILKIRLWREKKIILSTNRFCLLFSHRSRHHLTLLFDCNDPSFINFKLRLLNRSREYCLDAFLQSVPAFIITANSS